MPNHITNRKDNPMSNYPRIHISTTYRTDLQQAEARVVLDPEYDRTILYVARADDMSEAVLMAESYLVEHYDTGREYTVLYETRTVGV